MIVCLTHRVIRHFAHFISQLLLEVINTSRSLSEGLFPQDLVKQPICKEGDPGLPENWRPVDFPHPILTLWDYKLIFRHNNLINYKNQINLMYMVVLTSFT